MDMKKIITCAALLAGIVFFNGRLNAQVESDIVGYTTIIMDAGGWYRLGMPFGQLDGSATFTLTEAFSGFAEGDCIYLSANNAGSYVARYWKTDATGAAGWSKSKNALRLDETEYDCDTAVYLHKSVAGQIILSGVVTEMTNTFGLESGNAWSIVPLPWPEAKTLNDFAWTGCQDGDTVYIGSASGANIARYWKVNASTGAAGWSKSKNALRLDDTILTPGTAVYINKVSAGVGTVTIK